VDGKLRPASWPEAFAAIAQRLRGAQPDRVGAIVGDLAAVEEVYALKLLMGSLGVQNIDARQDGTVLSPAYGRASYLFNTTIAGIEDADAILIVGANPRIEASLVNRAHPARAARGARPPIGMIGENANLTYAYDYLGAGPETLA
jgi:NADH-quinone oxidoreductase subunit G